MESRGFNYAEEDSKEIRKLCTGTKQNNENGKHINESGLFFIRKEK
jgi:hypothetical protein